MDLLVDGLCCCWSVVLLCIGEEVGDWIIIVGTLLQLLLLILLELPLVYRSYDAGVMPRFI